MNDALLALRQITFGYRRDRAPVLNAVTFALRPGRILAIVGPNGAGKTTLLSVLLGWHHPWAGAIELAGRSLASYTRSERGRWLALAPQSEHTPFDYSVLDYVLMGRAPHLPPLAMPTAADYEIALSALEQVGMAALADQPAPQLSGGERQLMLAARAIAQQPRLLMTNHEPEVVLAVADDVLLMEAGQPPVFGPLDQVFTEAALSRIYQLPIRLVEVEGRKQVLWT